MLTPLTFTQIINSYLPEPQASLLNGIIFGIPLKSTKIFYQQLKMVGLLHLVVLSGTNITLLAAIVSSMTFFLKKQLSVVLTILTIVLFILFVGPQPPIIRAGFMGILTFIAILYGRKYTTLYILFLSAIFTTIFWPKWIKTLSFQLSYGATLGIVLFGQKKIPRSEKKWPSIIYEIGNEFKTSVAAQIFTAPLIFLHFKQISLVAPITNIFVSFLVAPLMIFGFLTAVLGKINFYFGLLPAYICYGILSYIVFVIEKLSKIPFAFYQFN